MWFLDNSQGKYHVSHVKTLNNQDGLLTVCLPQIHKYISKAPVYIIEMSYKQGYRGSLSYLPSSFYITNQNYKKTY